MYKCLICILFCCCLLFSICVYLYYYMLSNPLSIRIRLIFKRKYPRKKENEQKYIISFCLENYFHFAKVLLPFFYCFFIFSLVIYLLHCWLMIFFFIIPRVLYVIDFSFFLSMVGFFLTYFLLYFLSFIQSFSHFF